MLYRTFGNTGVSISALGFGAMRLPMVERGGKKIIDDDAAIGCMHRAFELGVNYIDSAYGYCESLSEVTVGTAVRAWKGHRVFVSTKSPVWRIKERGDYRRFLDEQLRKLDLPAIDFYHFHGLNKNKLDQTVLKLGLLEEAEKARGEGLIRFVSFSFHDKPEVMKEIIDTGAFQSVLCQYNLLDRSNEDAISYARSKGLGVVVMGPVGGGRLGEPSEAIQKLLGGGRHSTPSVALRFVLANPDVCCALSGMNTVKMVEENAATASVDTPLSAAERSAIAAAMEENKRLADLYCTGCNYCMPCPQEVNIPLVFRCMNYHRVYALTDFARKEYAKIGTNDWMKGARADACVECGACEEKCPQNIRIREQLKECARELA